MKKILSLVLICAMAVTLLAGCGESKPVLKVYNWGEYIDEDLLSEFEEQYGIEVRYSTFNTNEDLYTKVKAAPDSYDIIVPSDYMVAQMIEEDMLEKIDYNNVPNASKIADRFKNPSYDPSSEYSVPYLFGTVGILYNKETVGKEIDSTQALWDEQYKGKIIMMDSSRDSIGMTLKMLGYSMNETDPAKLEEAKQKLIEQKEVLLGYGLDEAKDKVISGEAVMSMSYVGVAMEAMDENEDLAYVVPKEGSNLAVDCFAIMKGTKMKKEAEQFINFMCDPQNAKRNGEEACYGCPIPEAVELMDPEFKNNEAMYPPDSVLDTCEDFKGGAEMTKIFNNVWLEVKTAN